MAKVKTSLYIDEELLKQLRIHCAMYDWKSHTDFIQTAIAEKIERDSAKKEGE